MPLKFSQVVFHLLGWLLFFSLILSFTYNSGAGRNLLQEILSTPYLMFYVTYVAILYLNANVLMPRFYFGKKHLLYFLFFLAILIAVYILSPLTM